jgi:hypothetical protein
VAELSQPLAEVRRELAGAVGELSARHTDELAQVRADFRTGLVNSHNQLVTQQHELHRALEAKLTSERQARYRDGIKQAADLRAVLDDVRNTLAEDRRELRVLVAAAIEGANQWFTHLRDELYERLETVIDVTAQSSASAASAVKALRKDLKAAEGDPRLLEALARLGEEIERLERKIPGRIALRLPDSELTAIAAAVHGGGQGATPTRARGAGKKGATTGKKAAPRAAAGGGDSSAAQRASGAAPATRRPPPTDPTTRSW